MADVRASGPMFDGRASAALDALCEEAVRDVADQAYAEWMTNLTGSIKNPTPYYETQVTTELHGQQGVVHDRGVIYGPWLEGTGSRNKTTRFKGYASARRATQTVEEKVPGIVSHTVGKYIGRMQ